MFWLPDDLFVRMSVSLNDYRVPTTTRSQLNLFCFGKTPQTRLVVSKLKTLQLKSKIILIF